MDELADTKQDWRKIVIWTDGLRWMIDSKETNSTILELKEICRQIIRKFDEITVIDK